MPAIMSLEGPRPSELDPIKVYPLWAIGGVLFGAWLAGTTTGRSIVRKIRGK